MLLTQNKKIQPSRGHGKGIQCAHQVPSICCDLTGPCTRDLIHPQACPLGTHYYPRSIGEYTGRDFPNVTGVLGRRADTEPRVLCQLIHFRSHRHEDKKPHKQEREFL